ARSITDTDCGVSAMLVLVLVAPLVLLAARQAYQDGLSASDKAALAHLATAAEEDVSAIALLLARAPPACQSDRSCQRRHAVFEAIRLDKPRALQALLQNGPPPPMPKELYPRTVISYRQYAHRLKTPRSAALWARLFGR
ncbi:hypothetical protein KQ945_12200, partial [Bacillus subtilis subsp. subtilis]|nr:hypothetical protein [Bacillus subtilis subsp. subtilis]